MGSFIGIAFYTTVLLFFVVMISAIRKSKRQLFLERLFTWSLRLLVIPLIVLSLLALTTKGFNAEIAHIAYVFLVGIPFNIILVFGWIAQEVHYYKRKHKIAEKLPCQH